MLYVISHEYHTTFALVEVEGNEFVISYGSRPDLTGLENNKVYEAGIALEILE